MLLLQTRQVTAGNSQETERKNRRLSQKQLSFSQFQWLFTSLDPNPLSPHYIQAGEWGLIPKWAKDKTIQNNTRIETLSDKPSFKGSINNRCLILAVGFYEWQWLYEKGKQKQKYLITLPNNELYTYAGLYSDWTNPLTRQPIRTYTIITTAANTLMAEIHNTKKQMPVIVQNQYDWLLGDNLIAEKVFEHPTSGTLF